jgi:hypothetical protein
VHCGEEEQVGAVLDYVQARSQPVFGHTGVEPQYARALEPDGFARGQYGQRHHFAEIGVNRLDRGPQFALVAEQREAIS